MILKCQILENDHDNLDLRDVSVRADGSENLNLKDDVSESADDIEHDHLFDGESKRRVFFDNLSDDSDHGQDDVLALADSQKMGDSPEAIDFASADDFIDFMVKKADHSD